MPNFHGTHAGRSAAFALVAGILALWAMACGSDAPIGPNQSPRVSFFGSPVEGDSVNYVVDFTWIGWDDDGKVVRSEYAVDIPDSFTPEQINDPATPGIDWTPTTGSHARIRFRVGGGAADVGAGTYPSDRASAPHTFFVRVFDDRGAHSPVAERSLNAWTILPTTTITEPSGARTPSYFLVGGCLTIRWSAEDPDGPAPDHRPTRTEYKVIPVVSVVTSTDANAIVNVDPGPNFPWLSAPDDSGVVTVSLQTGSAYVVAVRSIDEAGGVESRFEFGRNAVLMQSSSAPFVGRPTLTVTEPLLGRNEFPADGALVDYQVVAGQCLNFELSGDAQSYGGTIGDYRWCVDAAEGSVAIDDPPGCVPWGPTRQLPPLCFNTPGTHTVTLAIRSEAPACGAEAGGVTSGTIRLTVVPRPLDRDVLYVDDFFDPGADAEGDRRFLTALNGAGYTTVDQFDAWGVGDGDGTVTVPTLAELARYRLVFWCVRGQGGGTQVANSALLQASTCPANRILRAYVAAGGAVWINGEMPFAALKDRNGGVSQGSCIGSTTYGSDAGLSFGAGSFVTDYLHIAGGDFRDAKTNGPLNGLLRAHPTPRARLEGFPTLEADSTTYAYTTLGGLPLYDAMFLPTFTSDSGLDTLYTAETAGAASGFRNKPIAWRYADTRPTPRQGAVAITSFPLQKMKEGAPSHVVDGVNVPGSGLDGLVQVMAAWLRDHDATGAAAGSWTREAGQLHPRYDGQSKGR